MVNHARRLRALPSSSGPALSPFSKATRWQRLNIRHSISVSALWTTDASEITENQVEYTFGATAEAAFAPMIQGRALSRGVPVRRCGLYVADHGSGHQRQDHRFTLYDEADNITVTGTELDGDLADFLALMSAGDGRAAMQALYTGIHLSATNGRPGGWQGEVIQTGVFATGSTPRTATTSFSTTAGDRYNGGDGFDTVSYQHYLDNPTWRSAASMPG